MLLLNSEMLVRNVPHDRNYWFVRTFSGKLYDDYIENSHIGIGLNFVPNDILAVGEKNLEPIRELIQKNTSYKSQSSATRWANQLITFFHNVKIGDVVVIPNYSSSKISIGIVESNPMPFDSRKIIEHRGVSTQYPNRVRKVKWVNEVFRDDMNGDINALIRTHAGISQANSINYIIESYVSDLFILDDSAYLKLKINQDEDINAYELSRFLNGLILIHKSICERNGLEYTEDLYIKIKLQSKGSVILKQSKATLKIGGAILGVIVIAAAVGNNIDFTVKAPGVEIQAKGDGILKSISDFRDDELNRELKEAGFYDSLKRLEVQSPKLDSLQLDDNQNKSNDNQTTE